MAPPPGGVRTSLTDTARALGNNSIRFAGSPNYDIGQFSSTFQPSGLFSPGNPLVPTEEHLPRQWNYPVGYNTNYRPRAYEPIGFQQLRALADNHTETRLAIETRKDQIEGLEWQIRPRNEDNSSAETDTRAAALTEFFYKPDGITTFGSWLRPILDDLLVLDAPAIEIRYNRGGDIIALEQIDGATIKVLLDETGRIPAPPAPAFEQIIHGRPWVLLEDGTRLNTDAAAAKELFHHQLIYAPRNRRTHKAYGFSPVEQIVMTINIGLRRQLKQLQHFTEGNVPPGMINAPPEWTPDQLRQYQEWFDSYLAGNTANQTRILWGPAHSVYHPFTEAPYKDTFDEWLARIVCFAFSLPAFAFIDHYNRATAETAQQAALTEGLAPLLGWVKRMIDGIIQDRMGYPDLEFAWNDNREIDPKIQTAIHVDRVKNGMETINEARAELGQGPVAGGDEPMFITASGPVMLRDVIAGNYLPVAASSGEEAAVGGSPGAKPSEKILGGEVPADKEVAKAGTSPFGKSDAPPELAVGDATLIIERKAAEFLNDAAESAAAIAVAIDADNNGTIDEAAVAAIVAAVLAGLSWRALAANIKPDLIAVANDTLAESLAELGATLTAEQMADFSGWAADWAGSRTNELVTQLTASTPDLLRADLIAGLGDQKTIEDLPRIVSSSRAFAVERAALIAEYESTNAYHAAMLETFETVGVKTVRWVTVRDGEVEGICEENEAAGPIAVGAAFPSGHHRPPAHINCRCWIVPN